MNSCNERFKTFTKHLNAIKRWCNIIHKRAIWRPHVPHAMVWAIRTRQTVAWLRASGSCRIHEFIQTLNWSISKNKRSLLPLPSLLRRSIGFSNGEGCFRLSFVAKLNNAIDRQPKADPNKSPDIIGNIEIYAQQQWTGALISREFGKLSSAGEVCAASADGVALSETFTFHLLTL